MPNLKDLPRKWSHPKRLEITQTQECVKWGGETVGKPPKREHIEICDSGTDLCRGDWTSWGKLARKERPQNSNQSPASTHTSDQTTTIQAKPTRKRISATWVDDEPHGHSPPTCPGPKSPSPPRGDPATLIRGRDGSKLHQNPHR